jgi:1,2-diacylglycerol 3-alpha-glucosyltransferase
MAARADVVALDGAEKLNSKSSPSVRVLFCCSGLGIMNRGIESFFREAFDALRDLADVELLLLKGAGEATDRERIVWNLPRTNRLTKLLGRATGRTESAVEQWSTFFPVVRQIRGFKPDVVFYSDANLGFLLYRFRNWIGHPFRLLFSNGGPCHPPFIRTDYVHQVAPLYYDEAIRAGEPISKHFFVPYGISVPDHPPTVDLSTRAKLRAELGLPQDRPIVLSVGWVSRIHKRMDYVVREIAALPKPRPFLQLLGAIDCTSREIVELATELLGPDGFSARSVPYAEVPNYYRAADIFVSASLAEGFGRVLLEAMMHGLPVIAHRHPVMEYVVDDAGYIQDLSRANNLTERIRALLGERMNCQAAHARWDSVRTRFSWPLLRPKYREMFVICAESAAKE